MSKTLRNKGRIKEEIKKYLKNKSQTLNGEVYSFYI